MDTKRLGEDGQRRLRGLVDRFGWGDLAERLGLGEDGLGSILAGDYEVPEEELRNLVLVISALELVPSEAQGSAAEEGLFGVPEEEVVVLDEGGLSGWVVDAGGSRIVEEDGEGFGGVGGLRGETSMPDPAYVGIMTEDLTGATEAEARPSEGPAVEPGPSGNAAIGVEPVADVPDGLGPVQVLGVDIDQDGKPDVPLYGIDLSSRPGMAWTEQQDRGRMCLRNAHALATMVQYRIGMTRLETVTALGLVVQIELALITFYGESLPEPGQNWDAQKRSREIERRLARLRWVEQEQNREDSGIKGVWNRVRGKRIPSGKDLYKGMIENADVMILGMQEPDLDTDVLAEVLRFTGVVPGDPGFGELLRRPAAK